jgi:hypothetical protein
VSWGKRNMLDLLESEVVWLKLMVDAVLEVMALCILVRAAFLLRFKGSR